VLALSPVRLDMQRAAGQLAECRVKVTGESRRADFPSVGGRHTSITVHRKPRVTGPNVLVLGPIYFRRIWRPQSSFASRVTAGAFRFLTFTQCGERPIPWRDARRYSFDRSRSVHHVGAHLILPQQCQRFSRDARFCEPSCMRTCTRSRSGNAISGVWAHTGSMRTEAIVSRRWLGLVNAELVSVRHQYPRFD